jgi:protein involved in polysaccharide export with SLBB domain
MGKTVPEIADELEKRFQEVIPAAKLSVFLEEGNVMVKEFLDTLTSNEMQGSSRPLRIHSDGFINFPLIGEMHMVGKSLPVISQELETKYNEIFLGSLSVSFTLIDDTDGNVSVVGEVHKPGRFKIHGPTRVAELLAMAGGPNILAHKTAVLIKKTGENRYSLYYVQLDTDAKDLSQGFLNGALLTMNPQDILIVPKSNIGKINLWVHKYIERLFLFRGTHISINGRWDDL